MANDKFSFDIVSEVDLQEVDNAVHQVKKEMAQRFDFKGSKSSIDYNRAEKKITLIGDDDYKLRAVRDMLGARLIRRGVSVRFLTYKKPEKSFEGTLRQTADISTGISKERAKELVKIIKKLNLKVQAQIENDKVRVFSPKKDTLQAVIAHIKKADFPLALSFCNYR